MDGPRLELSLADAVLTLRELSRLWEADDHFELAQMIGHEPFVGESRREVPEEGGWAVTGEYASWRDSVGKRTEEVQTFLRKLVGSALSLFPSPEEIPE